MLPYKTAHEHTLCTKGTACESDSSQSLGQQKCSSQPINAAPFFFTARGRAMRWATPRVQLRWQHDGFCLLSYLLIAYPQGLCLRACVDELVMLGGFRFQVLRRCCGVISISPGWFRDGFSSRTFFCFAYFLLPLLVCRQTAVFDRPLIAVR